MTFEALRQPGCTVECHAEPHTLLDNYFYISGAIPRTTAYETGLPSHATQQREGGPWQMDPLIMDERYVVVRVKGWSVTTRGARRGMS